MPREALIVAGPNGAGKTTFARAYVAEQPRPFLSADAIAAQLRPDDPTAARVDAGRVFFTELNTHIHSGESFVVESTLAGRGVQRIIARLHQAGYTVTIAFLFLASPAACIARVRERVRKGGHDVPVEDIVRRYYRSKRNFWRVYRHEVDRWQLYFNNGDDFELVATGEGKVLVISDESHYQLFLQDLKADNDARS
ncbi:MAG: AAA family ATPase [Bacteroidetes bacterium]|nr:AAA family ATPase [Bacteroidota bacterium]